MATSFPPFFCCRPLFPLLLFSLPALLYPSLDPSPSLSPTPHFTLDLLSSLLLWHPRQYPPLIIVPFPPLHQGTHSITCLHTLLLNNSNERKIIMAVCPDIDSELTDPSQFFDGHSIVWKRKFLSPSSSCPVSIGSNTHTLTLPCFGRCHNHKRQCTIHSR